MNTVNELESDYKEVKEAKEELLNNGHDVDSVPVEVLDRELKRIDGMITDQRQRDMFGSSRGDNQELI